MWEIMFLWAPLPTPGMVRNKSRCTPVRMCSCYHTSCLGPKGQGKPGAQESPAWAICCSSVLKYSLCWSGWCYYGFAITPCLWCSPGTCTQSLLWRQAGRQSWVQATKTTWGSWEQGWHMQKCTVTEELKAVAAKGGWKLEGKTLHTLEIKPPLGVSSRRTEEEMLSNPPPPRPEWRGKGIQPAFQTSRRYHSGLHSSCQSGRCTL